MVFCLVLFNCGANKVMTPYSHDRLLLLSADSLFELGKYSVAVNQYSQLRDESANLYYKGKAQYKIALSYIYYDNPNASYQKALTEFKLFASLYPNHELVGIVNTWIKILTIFNEFSEQTTDNTSRLKDAELNVKKNSREYTTIQDSYLRCDKDRDSLHNRIKILEGVIEKLDKIQ
jgi:outer membrane protein assembly factor BamD (BamD/ComL family)